MAPNPVTKIAKIIQRALNVTIIISFGLVLYAQYHKGELPGPAQIVKQMRDEPVQTDISRPKFVLAHRGSSYDIYPKAEYLIKGVVVTHNNISGIADIYHTSKSVDVKDLCLVWGESLFSGIYKKLTYWSEPWTCNVAFKDREVARQFDPAQFSNNHLLPKNEAIGAKINAIHVADQVSIKGLLIDYCPMGEPDMMRKTSLTRDDTGNGACEVLYVEDIQVLKSGTPGWYHLFDNSRQILFLALILKVLAFLILPYLEFRAIK
jgi:hypothetical protein